LPLLLRSTSYNCIHHFDASQAIIAATAEIIRSSGKSSACRHHYIPALFNGSSIYLVTSTLPILDISSSLILAVTDGRDTLRRLEGTRGVDLVNLCLGVISHKLTCSNAAGIALFADESGVVLQMCRCVLS
jgi:hypothetical protein